mgnify:FL=1|jgi:hypothetical protein|tara:strand:+ start:292 stop:450 length:159 start_codon:yes stop_codon:yes gene_type:complete
MPIREFPERGSILERSVIVEDITLDGGTQASQGLATFEAFFTDGTIFDGGQA